MARGETGGGRQGDRASFFSQAREQARPAEGRRTGGVVAVFVQEWDWRGVSVDAVAAPTLTRRRYARGAAARVPRLYMPPMRGRQLDDAPAQGSLLRVAPFVMRWRRKGLLYKGGRSARRHRGARARRLRCPRRAGTRLATGTRLVRRRFAPPRRAQPPFICAPWCAQIVSYSLGSSVRTPAYAEAPSPQPPARANNARCHFARITRVRRLTRSEPAAP